VKRATRELRTELNHQHARKFIMAYEKNAKQSAALSALAKQHNISVRELMLADEHLSAVCDIFYDGLPKLARMTMKREKFQTFYLNQREKLADEMFPVKKS
jgi:hypothetical protein